MEYASEFLISLGGIFLLGLLSDRLGKRTFLPRVTLLLLFGIIIGKDVLDLVPLALTNNYELIAQMTLLMVGFLLGGKLTLSSLKNLGSQVLWISVSAAVVTTIIVTLTLMLFGISIQISILLGCIASATAPAAVLDVVSESKYKGRFSDLLLSIVALDDAWALILFGIGTAVVKSISGSETEVISIMMIVKEIGGAVLLGAVIGFPAVYLSRQLKSCKPILVEALGIVFICGGLAILLNVSFLIAAMVLGAVVSNFAKHHAYPFHAIEGIEWPFMVIFFILSGASLELASLKDIGLIGIIYIISRMFGKYIGALLGGQLSHANKKTKQFMGIALFPQAGVAIGMALIASAYFPEHRQVLLSVVISSTIFFEIIGPIFTRKALFFCHKME